MRGVSGLRQTRVFPKEKGEMPEPMAYRSSFFVMTAATKSEGNKENFA